MYNTRLPRHHIRSTSAQSLEGRGNRFSDKPLFLVDSSGLHQASFSMSRQPSIESFSNQLSRQTNTTEPLRTPTDYLVEIEVLRKENARLRAENEMLRCSKPQNSREEQFAKLEIMRKENHMTTIIQTQQAKIQELNEKLKMQSQHMQRDQPGTIVATEFTPVPITIGVESKIVNVSQDNSFVTCQSTQSQGGKISREKRPPARFINTQQSSGYTNPRIPYKIY